MFLFPVNLCLPLNCFPDERETGWSKAETDYLFRLLNDYALRFYIVADRYEWPGSERHVEDLKARYYAICRKLFKVRPLDSPTDQENRNTGTVQYGFDYGVFCPIRAVPISFRHHQPKRREGASSSRIYGTETLQQWPRKIYYTLN